MNELIDDSKSIIVCFLFLSFIFVNSNSEIKNFYKVYYIVKCELYINIIGHTLHILIECIVTCTEKKLKSAINIFEIECQKSSLYLTIK